MFAAFFRIGGAIYISHPPLYWVKAISCNFEKYPTYASRLKSIYLQDKFFN